MTDRPHANGSNDDQRQLTARGSVCAWGMFAVTAVAGLAADLLSKGWVFDWLLRVEPQCVSRSIIPGVMRFTLSCNPGVVFGFNKLPATVVIGAGCVAIVLVTFFFLSSPRRAYWTHAALGFIIAGALGNLYDRLFSDVALPGRDRAIGCVRDFIDFSQVGYKWVFNVADVLLVVGVGIILIQSIAESIRQKRHSKDKQPT